MQLVQQHIWLVPCHFAVPDVAAFNRQTALASLPSRLARLRLELIVQSINQSIYYQANSTAQPSQGRGECSAVVQPAHHTGRQRRMQRYYGASPNPPPSCSFLHLVLVALRIGPIANINTAHVPSPPPTNNSLQPTGPPTHTSQLTKFHSPCACSLIAAPAPPPTSCAAHTHNPIAHCLMPLALLALSSCPELCSRRPLDWI